MSEVKITGLRSLVDSYKKAGKDIKKQCAYIVSANAFEGRNEAVRKAPIAFGKLRQSIGIEVSADKLEQSVVANTDYAPYIEFGTGGKVSVPAEWAKMANDFREQNFSNDDIKEGMRPQPFMYPAWQKVKKQFSRDMIKFKKNG